MSTRDAINLDFEPAPAAAPDPEESWEAAAPAPRPAKREEEAPEALPPPPAPAAVVPLGRVMPHSVEAEECLLSSLMLDGEETLALCDQAQITPRSFYTAAHETVFAVAADLRSRRIEVSAATIAEELKRRKDHPKSRHSMLDDIGGIAFLTRVSSLIPTTAQTAYFVGKVRELQLLRDLIKAATGAVEECYKFSGGDMVEFAADIESKLTAVTRSAAGDTVTEAHPITDFDYPEADDPNVLLGADDYLGRGGGMLFVSHAGAGKSSFIMDAVMSWAIGLPWMGIRCNGPLCTLVIQAEDSDRYMGKLRRSFAHVHQLTAEQDAQLGAHCIVARVKGRSGPTFFGELRRLVAKHKPDLVVINPIYIYADGDIARSEFAQPFLVALDEVNREEKFGYILVHHTGKPAAKDAKGKRAEVEDWETIYMGFGSSYLANWPRCSALLEPRPKEKSRYWLKLGKGGMNAGVTKEVEQGVGTRSEPVTKIAIRHSSERMDIAGRERAVIYWEPDTDDGGSDAAASEDSKPPNRDRGGRRRSVDAGEFRTALAAVCGGREKRQGYNALYRAACNVKGIGKGAFNAVIDDCLKSGILQKDPDDGRYYVP